MNDNVIAIYFIIDEILKSLNHQEDARRKVFDSEIMTTLVVSALYFGGNIVKACDYMESHRHVPKMLSKSRFNRRMHAVGDLFHEMFEVLAEVFKSCNTTGVYLIDSFPVPICDNIRIKGNKLLPLRRFGKKYRGKSASKRRYFYGIKVVVITTEDGLPVEYCFLPGSRSDTQCLNVLPNDLPAESRLVGDSGFTNYEAEDLAMGLDQVSFEIVRKKNSKRGDAWIGIKLFKELIRKKIETTFSLILNNFPKKIHAVTIDGFLYKVFLFVFSYGLDRFINN